MPAKFAHIDGIAVHYVHAGRTTLPDVVPDLSRGELVVFLHDAGGNAGIWRRVASLLDENHSTLAFDFPGHGRSGGTESLGSIDAYSALFRSLARALGLRPAVLVGHGMGAAVALQAALRDPGSVRALVLVGDGSRFDVPQDTLETWQNVMRGRSPQPFTTEAFSPKTDFVVMREAWTEQVKTDPRVRYYDLVACAAHDAGDAVGQIDVPTLIVVGSDDRVAPAARADELRHAIRGATLLTIADAGHLVPMEKPAELAAAVSKLLSDLSDVSDKSDLADKSER